MLSIFDDMTQVTESEVQRMLPLVDEQRRDEALHYKHLFGQFACLKSWLMLEELLKPLGIIELAALFFFVISVTPSESLFSFPFCSGPGFFCAGILYRIHGCLPA